MNTAKGKTDYSTSTHRTSHDQYVGKQYGRWTILEILPELSKNGSVLCRARCSCERHTEKIAQLCVIRSGRSLSCGCINRELTSQRNATDLTGQKFNKLTALYKTGEKYSDGSIMWHCQCECGNFRDVPSTFLKSGGVKECEACSRKTHVEATKLANTKYDDFDRAIAHVFNGMQQRCYNPKTDDYPRYGAKGVTIYQGWLDDVSSFVKWAKETGYRRGMTIERKDGSKGYTPENCTWKDRVDQQNNLKSNHVIDVDGRRFTLTQCVRITGNETKHVDRVFESDSEAADIVRRILKDRADKNLPDPIEVMAQKRELERHLALYPINM